MWRKLSLHATKGQLSGCKSYRFTTQKLCFHRFFRKLYIFKGGTFYSFSSSSCPIFVFDQPRFRPTISANPYNQSKSVVKIICLINFNPLFRKINVITVICGRYIRGRFRFIPPDCLA